MSELRERVAAAIYAAVNDEEQWAWEAAWLRADYLAMADAAIDAMQAEPTEVEPLLADMDALITTARQQRFGMDTHSPEYIGNCGFCEGVRAVRELIAARKAAS
jgi:hypothetical protein